MSVAVLTAEVPSRQAGPDTDAEALPAAAAQPLKVPVSTAGQEMLGQLRPALEPLRAVLPSLTPSVRRRSGPDSPDMSPDAAAATADELDALQLSSSCAATALPKTLLTRRMCPAPGVFMCATHMKHQILCGCGDTCRCVSAAQQVRAGPHSGHQGNEAPLLMVLPFSCVTGQTRTTSVSRG